MALRQGWPFSGSCNLKLAHNKILTVSGIWNEHLLKRTSAYQPMELTPMMC